MKRFARILSKAQLVWGTLLIICFFITTLIQIASRYFGIVAMWTEEIAVYSFIYAVFMGASVMLYYDEHFKFTGFVDKMPVRTQKMVTIIVTIFVLIFSIYMLFAGIHIVRQFWSFSLVTIPSIKMGYIWTAVPVAGFTMSVYSLNKILNLIQSTSVKED